MHTSIIRRARVISSGFGGAAPVSAAASPASAFLARANAITTLSGTETTAYTNLINGLIADGNWASLDLLYIFATASAGVALLNLVSPSFTLSNAAGSTAPGYASFTVDSGFLGQSISGLTTGYAPSTSGQMTQNSISVGGYILTSSSFSGIVSPGAFDGTNFIALRPINSSDLNAANFPSTGATNVQGSWMASRTGASNFAVYENESAILGSPFSSTSAANLAITLNVLSYNNSGSVSGGGNVTYAANWAGAGVGATAAAQIQNRINAYMTALGINVY